MRLNARLGRGLGCPVIVLTLYAGLLLEPVRGEGPQVKGPKAPPPKPLTICAVPASMPRTGRGPDGARQVIDVAVAEGVGKVLGRPIEWHWCASPNCS